MSLNNRSRREFLSIGGIAVLDAFAFRGIAQARQTNHSLTLYVGTYISGKSEGFYIIVNVITVVLMAYDRFVRFDF